MRILFISTFYPPYVVGGWEQLVQEVNDHLKNRGHATHVLTSVHGVAAPTHEDGVDRLLSLESNLNHYKPSQIFSYKSRLQQNLTHTRQTINAFNPDIIFVHIMWNLTRGIPWVAEQLRPGRVVYYVADYWPYAPDPHTAYWQDPARNPLSNFAKNLIAPLPLHLVKQYNSDFQLEFRRVLCVSQAIKNSLNENTAIDPHCLNVVYNGIDTNLFSPSNRPNNRKSNRNLSLLYAGSLVWHKGVHTAIEAMSNLVHKSELDTISLTIVGSGHPDYESQLRNLVKQEKLESFIEFRGRVPREQMPRLMKEFDGLVMPSTWAEPLARITQEAMAAGLVVIGTTTGGSAEILTEEETGLTFAPEDAKALAAQIQKLHANPDLLRKLAENARQTVVEKFDIRRMIDEIETHLHEAIQLAPAHQ